MKITIQTIAIILSSFVIGHSQDAKENKKNFNEVRINYNARNGNSNNYPTYVVKQNGYIIFEVNDINLFRYQVSLTELQNNIINSTKLSEGNTQISIDPTVFNLTNINLNIQVIPVVTNADTKVLSTIEKEKKDKATEIERKKQEIEKENAKYLLVKGRINKINDIEKQLLQISSNLTFLNSILDSDLSKDQKKEKPELETNKRNLETEKDGLDAINNIANDKTYISTYLGTTRNQLQSDLNTIIDEASEIEYRYNNQLLKDVTDNSRRDNFNKSLTSYSQSIIKLNELTDLYQRLINILYSDQSFDNIYKDKINLSSEFSDGINEVTRDDIIKMCYKRLRDIQENFDKLSEAFSLVSNYPKAKEIFDKISAFHNQIKVASYHSFFMQIAKVYDAINESNFNLKFQTLMVSDNADLIHYNLKGEPHSNLPTSVETKPISFKYDVKIKGGVKMDVSTGVFWNIGLNDNAYRFERESDTSTKVITEKKENLFIPSFGVLFNIYRRSISDVKFGGNIGFSTNAERLNYYLGASILVGKSERININFGLAGAQVKTVSDLYDTKEAIQVPIADLPNEVPLRNPSPFKIGGYIGITFNLLGTKNKETLSKISAL